MTARIRKLLGVMCACLACAAPASGQDHGAPELAQAKSYFSAGASAYEMGDYAAAIQAFDAAYRLTPLPAVAFSLAQAERRQYFASRDRAHLERAIELYRIYLRDVEVAGRRADATDALAQLEPLAALSAPAPSGSEPAQATVDRTRLLISCAEPGATISLDGAAGVASPLIGRVTPGMHHVVVSAPGYFPTERNVEAIASELIPVELSLRERPATLVVRSKPDADLHVDGALVGRVGGGRRISLAGGSHALTFAENGHEVERVQARVVPGDDRELSVELQQTSQRTAAITLFVVAGAGLVAGAVTSALALEREEAAGAIEQQRVDGNITAGQLGEYAEARSDRDRWRSVAAICFGASLVSIGTGMLLYLLDTPDLHETAPAPRGPEVRLALPLPGSPATGVSGRFRF